MPDSHWQRVPPDEAREFERKWNDGDPPTPDHGSYEAIETTVPKNVRPGDPHIRIEAEEWSSVTCAPPPEIVMERCDKCDGHAHETKILYGAVVGSPAGGIQGPGVQDQQHVDDQHFGEHLGELYTNSTCRGSLISRTVLTWSVSGRQVTSWDRRTIDHVKNGFVWLSDISQNPCEDAGEDHGLRLDERFAEGRERPQQKTG